jgi:NAD(P)H-hydrate repair Nnr-like enzyme with NAD(P)H-hydrate dehydratase domain
MHRTPSVVCAEGRVQAWVVGSGWGPGEDNAARLDRRLAEGLPTVVDADALAVLPRRIPDGCLLTPHAGELAGMLGLERTEVESDPRGHALTAAQRYGATVLLKGSIQWVATPDGQISAALPGPAWTGQAGSGDTLAGVCGTLLAAGLPAREAALAGAGLQALTAARHPGPYSPDQLADLFPEVIGSLG